MGSDAGAEEQFGPYVVYERLGLGGMASVHRALERGLDGFERIVALKRLLPHLAADATFIKSFVREAKLASLLSHINIVQIFECGRVGTQYFISMEYIDGRDIRRILRHARKLSGPPPIHLTVGLLLQLCDALDYAHGKGDEHGQPLGLVHRDVSPSNVLVTSEGRLKVIDFGIAKAQSAQLRTQTGRVKGKLAYMAPEALAGKDLDARSDLFAVGTIAHELLTARPLFASKNDYQTLMKVQRGEILPPSTYNPHCPAELDAIVLRALAREPDERFTDAAELRGELHALRRKYNLQTSERDVAAWLDWAFAHQVQRAPSMTDVDAQPAPEPPSRPSRMRRSDDDEAVEIAWGADDHGNGEPIVLDDVPDVTDKHLPNPSALGAEVRLDLDDLADDIPTPLPSHGARPAADNSARAVAAALFAPPVPRVKRPTPSLPTRGPAVPVAAAREIGRGVPVAQADAVATASASPSRATMRARTTTIPPRIAPAASMSPDAAAAAPSPARLPAGGRNVPAGTAPQRPLAVGSEPRDAIAHAAPTAWPFDRLTPPKDARPETATVVSVPAFVGADPSPRHDGPPTDRTPSFHVDELGLAADTIPSMPVMRTAEPIVRFREPTAPPPTAAEPPTVPRGYPIPDAAPDFTTPMPTGSSPIPTMDVSRSVPLAVANGRSKPVPIPGVGANGASNHVPVPVVPASGPSVMTTKPGIGPASASPALLPVTPATALFAEPDLEPDTESSVTPAVATTTGTLRRTSAVSPDVRAPRPAMWRVLVMFVALAVLAGAVTAGALYLLQRRRAVAETSPPPPPPPRGASTGTVELSVEPSDAEIAINTRPLHVGAPWNVELSPGTYQVEIHHAGYKGWLTSIELSPGETHKLHVILDPLGAGVSDAILVLASTPGGLEVVLDGVPAGGKTPIKLSIQPGPHTVVLRSGGVDVWHKSLDARASAVYELRPTLVDPATRTRAGATDRAEPDRALPPEPAPPAVDPGTASSNR